jgi:hypothetical protein
MSTQGEDPKKTEEKKDDPQVPHQAHVGHKDTGEAVTTAHGERIDGRITDLADGDA